MRTANGEGIKVENSCVMRGIEDKVDHFEA